MKNFIQKSIVPVFIIAVLVTAHFSQNTKTPFEYLKDAYVRIDAVEVNADGSENLLGRCSGTFISNTRILTAKHCMKTINAVPIEGTQFYNFEEVDVKLFKITTSDGRRIYTPAAVYDEDYDIGLIGVGESGDLNNWFSLDYGQIEEFQEVYSAGSPGAFNGASVPRKGMFLRDHKWGLTDLADMAGITSRVIDITIQRGDSGSLAITEDGSVVGLLVAGLTDSEIGSMIALAVPAEKIKEFVEKHWNSL